MLLLLLKEQSKPSDWLLVMAGTCAGWACVCRPNAAIIVAVVAGWMSIKHKGRSLFFLVPLATLIGGSLFRKPLDFSSMLWVAAGAGILLMTSWKTWAGGACFGPRYLCEAALLQALIIPFMWDRFSRFRRRVLFFLLATIMACHIHIMGARHGDRGWNHLVFKGDDIAVVWQMRSSQLFWTLAGAPDE